MSVIHSRSLARKIAKSRAGLGCLDSRRPRQHGVSSMAVTSLRRTVALPEQRLVLSATAPSGSRVLRDRTHGLATRVPPLKNARTARGWTYFGDTIVYHESELEHRVSLRLQARNDIAQLHSQFPVFKYRDDAGELHEHTSDFYILYKDGYRQAVVVKEERKRKPTEALIDSISADPSAHQVDSIILRTEKYGSIDALENALMVRWSREYHDQDDVDELVNVVSGLHGWFRFGTLLQNCESIERRRVAVWRLIDLGMLFSVTGEKISDLSFLGYAPAGGPTGLLG